jgi:hypothetical protein
MKYYEIDRSEEDLEGKLCRIEWHKMSSDDDLSLFMRGIKLDSNYGQSLELAVTPPIKEEIPDYIKVTIQWILLSEKVTNYLKDVASDSVQFIDPMFDINKSSKKFEKYKLLNVLNQISCVDFESSHVSYNSFNQIAAIFNMVLVKEKIPSKTIIFRVKELVSTLVVNEIFKDFAEANFSGFSFEPIKTC